MVCSIVGGVRWGLTGFFFGGLSGLLAPAALLWLGVMAIGIALFMGVYLVSWWVIWLAFKWFIQF
ncbi:MAG: hypothetical protein U1E84_11730 [Rhodoferax sp.]